FNMTSQAGYPFVHGLWPFASCGSMKSLDLGLHPAFMHTPYPPYHLPQYHTPTVPAFHPGVRSKADSFTIDAILNKDEAGPRTENCKSPRDTSLCKKDILYRRHQRLLDSGHPYLSPSGKKSPNQTEDTKTKVHVHENTKDAEDKKSGVWKQTKGKRVRTIFTPEQLERLEAEFEKQQYMVGTERYYLACSLNLSEAQVKVWFQNRRIKWRKQTLEQQQAKLARFDMYKDLSGNEECFSDEENETGSNRFPTSPDQRCVTSEVPTLQVSPF
ncbi:hypothetical protein FSP39_018760, partial [Pinctada imbricata]